MKGKVQRFRSHLGLDRKHFKKGKKKRDNSVTVFRDYRGTRGAIKDAEGR